MPTLLCIETATATCAVSLSCDGKILASIRSTEGFDHAEKLTDFIKDLFDQSSFKLGDLDAVAVSGGPGSYTGLRIGVSTAKGICWSLDKPLIAVPTLKSMTSGAQLLYNAADNLLWCPMIDARRMEVYTAIYDNELNEIAPVSAKIIDEEFVASLPVHTSLVFFGDGMSKAKTLLSGHPSVVFLDDYVIHAEHLIRPGENAFAHKEFVHTALYEPFYLKEFVTGKSAIKK